MKTEAEKFAVAAAAAAREEAWEVRAALEEEEAE